jgi:hypothetical protein
VSVACYIDGMPPNVPGDGPDNDDVVISYVEQRDDLDVYRVTKGSTVIGEFTGRSIGSSVFKVAVEHAGSRRAVWLKDELRLRRLLPPEDVSSVPKT